MLSSLVHGHTLYHTCVCSMCRTRSRTRTQTSITSVDGHSILTRRQEDAQSSTHHDTAALIGQVAEVLWVEKLVV